LSSRGNDIFCTDELCDDHECGVSNGEEEEVVKCDREPVTSFANTLVAYETAKSFVYMHSYFQITLGRKVICMQTLM